MEVSVSFGKQIDLINFFKGALEDIEREVKSDILKDVSKIMMRIGPRVEKKIFRYIANRAFDHLEPPKSIEGYPVFQGVIWEPLAQSTIRKKKHRRKFVDSGSLRNYLLAKTDATYWYGKPKTIINESDDQVLYYSMFNYKRKPFRAHDNRGASQEFKLTGPDADDGDNYKRPVVSPMEDFLFGEKLDALVDKAINDYMEENYGVRYDVFADY